MKTLFSKNRGGGVVFNRWGYSPHNTPKKSHAGLVPEAFSNSLLNCVILVTNNSNGWATARDCRILHNGFAKLRVLEWKLVENKGRFFVLDFVWFVLTAQEELEALLWVCLTPIYVFFIYFFESIFSWFFFSPKKKGFTFFLSHISCPFNWKSLYYRWEPKNLWEKSSTFFFSEKKIRKLCLS